jgi:hypothetical protein
MGRANDLVVWKGRTKRWKKQNDNRIEHTQLQSHIEPATQRWLHLKKHCKRPIEGQQLREYQNQIQNSSFLKRKTRIPATKQNNNKNNTAPDGGRWEFVLKYALFFFLFSFLCASCFAIRTMLIRDKPAQPFMGLSFAGIWAFCLCWF